MRNVESFIAAAITALLACAPGSLAATEHIIVINGLTGDVKPHAAVVRPDDKVVIVKVCPADLINYDYEIKEEHQDLKESFPIVGVGTVTQATSGAVPAVGRSTLSEKELEALIQKSEEDDELERERKLLNSYIELRNTIAEQRKKVVDAIEKVNRAGVSLLDANMGCDQWPNEITSITRNSEKPPEGSFFKDYKELNAALDNLDKMRQDLITTIIDLDLLDSLNKVTDRSQFRSDLRTQLDLLAGELQALRTSLNNAHLVVSRWQSILAVKPAPVVTDRVDLTYTSARFTVSVARKPITPESQREVPPGTEVAKIEPSIIAVTSFENRALHRFNVSLGMVGTLREDSRDFEITPAVAGDGTVTFRVRETKRDEWKADATAFLGIYLGRGVDNFNPARGVALMLMLGSEISASPSSFFLGIGFDSPKGVVAGFGLTEYEGIDLAPGWEVGQEIPRLAETGENALKPRVATVPKVRQDTMGFYAFLGFRPSIFRAFLDRRKP